ncbi:MAG: triose-phosphate isomerase [Bacteroidota bacterium]
MLVAGNWKMNTTPEGGVDLARDVARRVRSHADRVAVAVCPPPVSLAAVGDVVRGTPVRLGAQTMHEADSGAYTGEVSAPMLNAVGCHYVILGHSERRQLFGETDAGVNRKTKAALAHGVVPIVCVGETLGERKAGDEEAVVGRQVDAALDGVELSDAAQLVVAYEPVWAIGTGETASPEQAQAMHRFIRDRLDGLGAPREVEILYGGSVKPGNAADLFAQPDIDGGLIGGASLDAESFAQIVEAASKV